MAKIGLIYNENHVLHNYMLKGFPSPEGPERVEQILKTFKEEGILFHPDCHSLTKPSVPMQKLLAVHPKEYLTRIKKVCDNGGGFVGDSTYLCPDSFDVAKSAAECAIAAGNAVLDDFDFAFSFARPPGHHASADKCGGFCIFNNAAILARHLQTHSIKKILILNLDAHASNGTQSIFYQDSDVMCISLHQEPKNFYPSTAFASQIGEGEGRGYTINVEMPKESGNREYEKAFDIVVMPVIEQFDPDFIILECGFDAYYKEELTSLDLTISGYYDIFCRIADTKRRTVALMEGGYHEDGGLIAYTLLMAFLGQDNKFNEPSTFQLESFRHNQCNKQFKENILKLIKPPYGGLDSFWTFGEVSKI